MNGNNRKNYIKMRSIARRISSDWNFRLFRNFILIDIIFVIAKIYIWRIVTEAGLLGYNLSEFWNIRLTGNFEYSKNVSPSEFIDTFCYVIPDVKEKIHAGSVLIETSATTGVMMISEFLIFMSGCINGGKRVRRKLEPLNQLATTAQMISTANFEIDKFHDLENALEKIDTENTDCMVSTGNTELQGIENAINNLIKRMRNSYIQQARFVSDASHELRTPIAVIQGYANMLSRWGKDDEKILDESITAIQSESESMNKLVEQLLFLARGDNGKNQLTIEKFDLNDMINEIYDEYQMVDTDHQYILKINHDKPIYAYGDYAMLKQTARILVDNAIKYTPAGNEIIVSSGLDDTHIPCFDVQDTGIGITSEDIPKVFERFYRADDARNRKTGGTGLGLSIARWIVDKHEGYFKLASCIDAGTKFTVCLPKIHKENNDEQLIDENKG